MLLNSLTLRTGCYARLRNGDYVGPFSVHPKVLFAFRAPNMDGCVEHTWYGSGICASGDHSCDALELLDAAPRIVRTPDRPLPDGVWSNNGDGTWSPAIPAPFHFGLFPWIRRRLQGYRDIYGRKAQFIGWKG